MRNDKVKTDMNPLERIDQG